MSSLCCYILNGELVNDLFISFCTLVQKIQMFWFGMKTKDSFLRKFTHAEYPSWSLLHESNICYSFGSKKNKMNKEGLEFIDDFCSATGMPLPANIRETKVHK